MKKRQTSLPAQLPFALSMVIFGTIGLLRRQIGLDSGLIACARGLLGCALLLVLQRLLGRKPNWRALRPKLGALVLSGVLMGLNWMLLFEAYRYTSIAVATLCYYMAPVILLAISPFVFGETLGGRQIFCMLLAVAGMVLISGLGGAPSGSWPGIALGLGAAVLYAFINVINRKALRELDAYDKTFVQLGAAGLIMLPYLALTGGFSGLCVTPRDAGLLLLAGVVHTALPYALYFGSMVRLPTRSVALLSYLDPLTALLLSALVLREPLSVAGIVGAGCILGATVVSEVSG